MAAEWRYVAAVSAVSVENFYALSSRQGIKCGREVSRPNASLFLQGKGAAKAVYFSQHFAAMLSMNRRGVNAEPSLVNLPNLIQPGLAHRRRLGFFLAGVQTGHWETVKSYGAG
jgi:hypothetical protein